MPDVSLSFERRRPWFRGPQGACHPHALEISLVEQGITWARLGRDSATLTRGQVGFIAPGTEHSSWTEDQVVVECNLHLSTRLLDRLADEVGRRPLRWRSGAHRAPPQLTGIVSALRTEMVAREPTDENLLTASLSTSLGICLMAMNEREPKLGLDVRSSHRKLRRVEEVLRDASAERFSLDELAVLAGMSRYHFLRSFKKQYGLTPHAYLVKLRLRRAVNLMRTTDLPLTAIALDSGFASSSRFTEAFQRAFGLAPSKWRLAPRQFPER